MNKVPHRRLDVLFIEPDSAGVAYQDLSKVYSAIETPTWSLLLAQSCRSKGYGVGILDQTAERLTDELALKKSGMPIRVWPFLLFMGRIPTPAPPT